MPRTNYIWDEVNDTLLAETDEAGNTIAEYTHEPGQFGPLISQRRNGHTYYHHYDGLGSTRALTNESGNVTDTFAYDAWGNETATTGASINPFRWVGTVGYYWDQELATLYIRARVFEPVIARWMSHDPIGYHDNTNLYEYAGDCPTGYTDPSGEIAPVVGVAAAAVACMYPHFLAGMHYYQDNEELRHCWTSCVSARSCALAISAAAGLGFEVLTEAIRALYGNADFENSLYDLMNNAVGLSCAGIESVVPLLGNVTRWFRGSCECCCRRRV